MWFIIIIYGIQSNYNSNKVLKFVWSKKTKLWIFVKKKKLIYVLVEYYVLV